MKYYGLRLHSGEYMRLCRLIRDRQIRFQVVRGDRQNRQVVLVCWKGKRLLLVYSPVRQLLHTALHPERGLTPRDGLRTPRPRRVTRRHAFAQRGRGGLSKHPECENACIQVSRPGGALGRWRSK
ncbi:hypothetical protein D9600_13120 [Deinococcus sp. DB0503]|nr:hypothetical protein [Deinococcus sp. DB0503]